LNPSLFAWGRVTWVKSQWKLSAYPGHFSVQINTFRTTMLENKYSDRKIRHAFCPFHSGPFIDCETDQVD
jgi:hypothetical protein